MCKEELPAVATIAYGTSCLYSQPWQSLYHNCLIASHRQTGFRFFRSTMAQRIWFTSWNIAAEQSIMINYFISNFDSASYIARSLQMLVYVALRINT